MNDDAKILIITVNFRNAGCTLELLTSASALDGFNHCNVLIVDNNSGDDSVPRMREAIAKFNNVELLRSPQNRGYFGGARWGLDEYLARHRSPDWVIVCNNDIVFDDSRFLSHLLERDPAKAGVIAPAIISRLTGCDANPIIRERPSSSRMWRYRLLLSQYYVAWLAQCLAPLVRKARNSLYVRRNHGHDQTAIYAPHGSFIIFSRRFFESGGFIDHGFFLYAEEFCVAEMCRHLRVPVLHDPELRVWHEVGQTLGRVLTRETYMHQKNGFGYALARYNDSYGAIRIGAPQAGRGPFEQPDDRHQISPAGERIQ